MPKINFFQEDTTFKLTYPRKTARWIQQVISQENATLKELNYIFCSDAYLLKINIEYLNHKTLTDIITFDNGDSASIEGDIFISVERVKENAIKFNKEFDDELHRVIIHGALHLLGYSDKEAKKIVVMRKKEDAYLSLRG